MGSMRSTSSTVVSGIHWQHALWHHWSFEVVGFKAPPSTGHDAHSGVRTRPAPPLGVSARIRAQTGDGAVRDLGDLPSSSSVHADPAPLASNELVEVEVAVVAHAHRSHGRLTLTNLYPNALRQVAAARLAPAAKAADRNASPFRDAAAGFHPRSASTCRWASSEVTTMRMLAVRREWPIPACFSRPSRTMRLPAPRHATIFSQHAELLDVEIGTHAGVVADIVRSLDDLTALK